MPFTEERIAIATNMGAGGSGLGGTLDEAR
jgi:hypothetical protein